MITVVFPHEAIGALLRAAENRRFALTVPDDFVDDQERIRELTNIEAAIAALKAGHDLRSP